MSASDEATLLRDTRASLLALEGDDWWLTADGDRLLIDSVGSGGTRVTIAEIFPVASADERDVLANALERQRRMEAMVTRCAKRVRELSGAEGGRSAAGAAPTAGFAGTSPSRGEERPRDGWRGGTQAGRKNYAAEAAMKCEEPGFLKFLAERHGLEAPLTPERAAQKVRSICGVSSRKELNDNDAAAAAWKALRDGFEHWRRFG